MYKITVPVHSKRAVRMGRDRLLEEMRKLGAERVLLVLGIHSTEQAECRSQLEALADNCEFFKKHGLEVGAWLWTFMIRGENTFTHMRSVADDRVSADIICPSDKEYRRFAGEYLAEIAKCGVDMIIFDDDLRYGFFDIGFGCLCENHVDAISEILGEELTREELSRKILSGGKNKYRSALLEANGRFLEEFARDMRTYVDSVNPGMRFGYCSCLTSWDIDGTNPMRISRILAGDTQPILRLIGAPYWAVDRSYQGSRLQDVIEFERMQLSWYDKDIEIICEGDVFPRPRTRCPASYLEGFDTAMRADGGTHGIIKYALDYVSGADYETGYVKSHERNIKLYRDIEENFCDKTAVGIRVYEFMKKFEYTQIPEELEQSCKIQEQVLSAAAKTLAECSIPTVYETDGVCGIAFGDNARYIDKDMMKNGLIIDAYAARIFMERGIDIGIEQFGEVFSALEEHYLNPEEYVRVEAKAYRASLNPRAEVQSRFVCGEEENPASYLYQNDEGQKFLVLLYDAYFADESLHRNYMRSRQIAGAVRYLSGKALPAYSRGNPDLYIMCKENDNSRAVGLWNFFADSIAEPVIELDRSFSNIKFINCSGKLCGNKVYLSEMAPFAFAGILLT